MAARVSLTEWYDQGRRVPVSTPGGDSHRVFVHTGGEGEHITLLHGFPTSSWDWAPLVDGLEGVEHLAVDHLGFGDADKPAGYGYTLVDQLEVLVDLWDRMGVEQTALIAHDYSVSLAQEALARLDEGAWEGPSLDSMTLLNGGLFYSAIDRKLIQDVLRWPIVGTLVGAAIPYPVFARELADTFAEAHRPSHEQLKQHWEAVTRRGGRWRIADVADYLDDRRAHEDRWTQALVAPPVPVRYVWGPEDPISGRSIQAALRDRVPDPDVVEFDGVGHYPQLEAPERVLEALPWTDEPDP